MLFRSGGKSVDTSMGLTPLGGVMMGTRTGDLDPAIIPFVIDREPEMADAERIRHVFNKESGLLMRLKWKVQPLDRQHT